MGKRLSREEKSGREDASTAVMAASRDPTWETPENCFNGFNQKSKV